MYVVAEFMLSLYYFMFYRMLFEENVDWGVFVLVQFFHFAVEWIVYCFRSTETYFALFPPSLALQAPSWCRLAINPNPLSLAHRDWQLMLSLDFALRLIVIGISAAAFLLLLLLTMQCSWVRSDLKPIKWAQFLNTCLQVSLCVILEALNFALMRSIYYTPQGLSVLDYAACGFTNSHLRVICFCIAVCQFLNPFQVYENYDCDFEYS